jgi:hypothetical protein
MDGGS